MMSTLYDSTPGRVPASITEVTLLGLVFYNLVRGKKNIEDTR